MEVDLRSDTVTKPTKDMLDFMFQAHVGDDVFGEDPTIVELQQFAADYFGMEMLSMDADRLILLYLAHTCW